MIVTKNTAVLIPLVVNDIYGETPSIIIKALLLRGPSRLHELLEPTGLAVLELKHGLAVLTQYNLIHYSTTSRGTATYEASVDSCYSLLRIGKIDELIGRKYGHAEQEVVRSLHAFGLVELGDLSKAFGAQSTPSAPGAIADPNGERSSGGGASSAIKSIFHLHDIVARLIQLEVLDVVDGPEDFANLETVLATIDAEYSKTIANAKGASAKDKLSVERAVRLRKARDRGKRLKHRLDSEYGLPGLKKRKLGNGNACGDSPPNEQRCILEANTILKLNYEKCLVDLRIESLVRFAEDTIGETTSRVYESLLHLVTEKVSRCQLNSRVDGAHSSMFDDETAKERGVTPSEILDFLDITVALDNGIAKVSKDRVLDDSQLDDSSAGEMDLDDEEQETSQEVSQEASQEAPQETGKRKRTRYLIDDSDDGEEPKQNGTRHKGVKFGCLPEAKDSKVEALRRHLMLLCTDKRGFARQCSKKGEGRFTVDFDIVLAALREAHIDAMVEATAGLFGLRLVNALKHLGKLDEKTLSMKTFLPKRQVQTTMAKLLEAGFVDVQEVPKDNSRVVDRSFCLWFCEKERIRRLLPERLCEVMVRCFQVRDVEKAKVRDILDFVRRTDVKGRVEEVLDQTYYRRYRAYQDKESRLLGSIFRLDEIVACLRDY